MDKDWNEEYEKQNKEESIEIIVYITDTGSKYHSEE